MNRHSLLSSKQLSLACYNSQNLIHLARIFYENHFIVILILYLFQPEIEEMCSRAKNITAQFFTSRDLHFETSRNVQRELTVMILNVILIHFEPFFI